MLTLNIWLGGTCYVSSCSITHVPSVINKYFVEKYFETMYVPIAH